MKIKLNNLWCVEKTQQCTIYELKPTKQKSNQALLVNKYVINDYTKQVQSN